MPRTNPPHQPPGSVRAEEPANPSRPRSAKLFFLPEIAAALLTLGALLFPNPTGGLVIAGSVSVCFALIVVWRRGGHFLTPSGVYFMATGIFVGVSCWLVAIYGSWLAPDVLRDAGVLAILSTIGTELVTALWGIGLRTSWPGAGDFNRADSQEFVPPRQFFAQGLVLVAVSRLPFLRAFGDALAPGLGLVGVMILGLSASSLRQRATWAGASLWSIVAFIVPIVWLGTIFNGGGRIQVAGVLIAAVVGWAMIRPARWQKIMVIAAVPIFLLGAGYNRLERLKPHAAEFADPNAVNLGLGLESVYVPFETWAEIISQDDHASGRSLGPRYGATFVNTTLLPVPRSWWPGKPKGFGAELTEVLRPDLARFGHSMGALAQGEWYANFGYWGLGFMAMVTGWALAMLDRWHARLVMRRFRDPKDWWETTILLCIVSSLAELVWAGSFSFFARGGFAAVLAWLLMKMRLRSSRVPSERPVAQRAVRAPTRAGA